jgi:hypothetical protein
MGQKGLRLQKVAKTRQIYDQSIGHAAPSTKKIWLFDIEYGFLCFIRLILFDAFNERLERFLAPPPKGGNRTGKHKRIQSEEIPI